MVFLANYAAGPAACGRGCDGLLVILLFYLAAGSAFRAWGPRVPEALLSANRLVRAIGARRGYSLIRPHFLRHGRGERFLCRILRHRM